MKKFAWGVATGSVAASIFILWSLGHAVQAERIVLAEDVNRVFLKRIMEEADAEMQAAE